MNNKNNKFKRDVKRQMDKTSGAMATNLASKSSRVMARAAQERGKSVGNAGSGLSRVDPDVQQRMHEIKAAERIDRRMRQKAGMGRVGGIRRAGSLLNQARKDVSVGAGQMADKYSRSMASDPAAPAGQGKHDEFETEAKSRLKNLPNADTRGNIMLGGDTSGALGAGLTLRNFSEPAPSAPSTPSAPSASNTFSDTMNPKDQGFINYLEMNGFSQDEASDDNWRKYQTEKGFYNSPPAFASGGKVGYAFGGEVAGNGNIPTQPNGDDTLATLKSGEVVLTKEQQAALGGDKAMAQAGVPGFGVNPDPEQAGGMPAFAGGGEVNPYFNMNQANSPSLFAGAGTGPLLGTDPYTPSRLSDNATPFRPVAPVGHRPIQYPPQSPFGGDAIDWKVEYPPYSQAEYQSGESPPLPVSGDLPTSGQPSRPPLPPLFAPQSQIPTPASEISLPKTSKSPIRDLADIKDRPSAASDAAYQQSLDDEVLYGKSDAAGFGSDINSYNVAKDRADATVAEIKKNRKAGKTALGFDRGKNKDGSDRKEWEQLTADEILKAQKSSRDHAARNKKLSDSKKDPTYGMDARTKAYFEAPAKRNKAKQAERAARKKQSEAFKAELQRSLDIEDLKKTDPEKAMDYIEKYQSNEKVKAGLKESNRVKARNKRLGL